MRVPRSLPSGDEKSDQGDDDAHADDDREYVDHCVDRIRVGDGGCDLVAGNDGYRDGHKKNDAHDCGSDPHGKFADAESCHFYTFL